MATLTVYDRDASLVFVDAASGGDEFANDEKTELHVYNGSASAVTVTVVATRRCSNGFLEDHVDVVPSGEWWRMGPFLHSRFGNGQRLVSITYSAVTSVTVAVQRQR